MAGAILGDVVFEFIDTKQDTIVQSRTFFIEDIVFNRMEKFDEFFFCVKSDGKCYRDTDHFVFDSGLVSYDDVCDLSVVSDLSWSDLISGHKFIDVFEDFGLIDDHSFFRKFVDLKICFDRWEICYNVFTEEITFIIVVDTRDKIFCICIDFVDSCVDRFVFFMTVLSRGDRRLDLISLSPLCYGSLYCIHHRSIDDDEQSDDDETIDFIFDFIKPLLLYKRLWFCRAVWCSWCGIGVSTE